MMLTQTTAMLVDAYRELNAKKLFWITLVLSGLCVVVFGITGINEEGITALWFTLPIPVNSNIISPELFYKTAFLNLGIGIWLTWIATVLALVSTAGIFPTLLTGGQIETMLSKPISRTRLFLTKFITGLLFVGLQVSLFCIASILVIGLRGGTWMPEILLAIPVVIVFFSFLFCVMTLFGILTRSTIASLLLTILFWFFLFILNAADQTLVGIHERVKIEATTIEARLVLAEKNAALMYINRAINQGEVVEDSYQPTQEELDSVNVFLPLLRDNHEKKSTLARKLAPWRNGVFIAKTALPKTSETVNLLTRFVMSQDDLDAWLSLGAEDDEGSTVDEDTGDVRVSNADVNRATTKAFNDRSLGWVLGTSLLFEAFVLLIAGLIFARRDF
ncbi:MAG: hypothetical protein COB69_05575 [Phycisphaera sp.]|nr:MAG: hypothetical protein COB69_05575 [Phycisphaera sp.]